LESHHPSLGKGEDLAEKSLRCVGVFAALCDMRKQGQDDRFALRQVPLASVRQDVIRKALRGIGLSHVDQRFEVASCVRNW
jgi:hypothetical protein